MHTYKKKCIYYSKRKEPNTTVSFREKMQQYVNVIRYFPSQNMQVLLYIVL